MLERKLLAIVLLLALLRGLIYAIVLPTWDLNDEEQHFDYVQHLAETGRLPTMGDSYLSPEILSSIAETDRWWHLGLPRPAALDARQMGLEGYSYEAYQPPLYYLILAIPYGISSALIPWIHGDASQTDRTLIKLYVLRLLTVALSVASTAISYAALRRVFAAQKELASFGIMLLLLIPERTMALSRVNNDSLVALLSAATLLLLLKLVHRPITSGDSLVLGTLLGLGIVAKVTAMILLPLALLLIAWQALRVRLWTHFVAHGGIVLVSLSLVSGWFLVRNQWLYGDLTGTSAFLNLVEFSPRYAFLDMLIALWRAVWATRWSDVAIDILAVLMAIVWAVALMGLLIMHRGNAKDRDGQHTRESALLLVGATIIWVVPLWLGVSAGVIQHIEGRFVIAAYAPAMALLLLGLSGALGRARAILIAWLLALVLAAFDAFYVLRYLLGGYYFREALDPALFFANKPDFVSPTLVTALGLCYLVILGFLLWTLRTLVVARWPNERSLAGDVPGPQRSGAS